MSARPSVRPPGRASGVRGHALHRNVCVCVTSARACKTATKTCKLHYPQIPLSCTVFGESMADPDFSVSLERTSSRRQMPWGLLAPPVPMAGQPRLSCSTIRATSTSSNSSSNCEAKPPAQGSRRATRWPPSTALPPRPPLPGGRARPRAASAAWTGTSRT